MYYENPDGVSVHDGFPNPATDSSLQGLDLNGLLVWHSASTYFMAISGNQWQAIGIFDRDIAIIDRALAPRPPDLVIWQHDDEFAISHLGSLKEGCQIFGTVTAIIHRYWSKP